MKPVLCDPVKLFFGALYSDSEKLEQTLNKIEKDFGPIDFRSQDFNFSMTDYYVPEMGAPIYRLFVSNENLISPQEIAKIKLLSNDIEDEFAESGKRKVNLDPGYLDYDKVVLASAKYNGDKIYLERGIWADLTLRFKT